MNHAAALVSLATSVPPHQFHQKQLLEAALGVVADRYPQLETLESLFANTGIRHRYGVMPMEWYLEHRGWPERTKAFLDGAERLFLDVARNAIAQASLTAGDIDCVVTVCSTGIATPTLEARVAGKIGFRSDVSRVPVFGLGCAGGVSGLSIASKLAQARPGSNVLLVALELCTLAVRHDELTRPISSPRACSATVRPRSCSAPAMAAPPRSRRPVRSFGLIRSTSWDGASTLRALA